MMEMYTLLATFFFFWQWKESVLVYIDRTYVSKLASQQDDMPFEKKDLFNSKIILKIKKIGILPTNSRLRTGTKLVID